VARAREVFKPSADSARHLVSTEKKIQFWVWGSLGGRHMWGCVWPNLPDFRRQTNEPNFSFKFVWKLHYHPSL